MMKILRILLAVSSIFSVIPMACFGQSSYFDQNGYDGKNGKDGQGGENGEDGEDGGFYGGKGGKGGDGGPFGGNGGKGGNGGFFGGNGGNGGNGGSRGASLGNVASRQVDECEYNELKSACRILIAKVEKHLTEHGNVNSAIAQQVFKLELSNYLLSLGTPASRRIHAEYEAVGWKYPVIKAI